jgi:hypothetical protein
MKFINVGNIQLKSNKQNDLNAIARISKLAFKKYNTTEDRNKILNQLSPEQKPINPLNPKTNKK